MKYKLFGKKVVFLTLIFLLFGGWNTSDALAGRYIFNQTPETLEKAFGSPVETAECVPEPNRTEKPTHPSNNGVVFVLKEVRASVVVYNQKKVSPYP